MKLKFANNHEYQYDYANAVERVYIAEQMRNTLEVDFPVTVDPISIMGECTEENLETITLTDDQPETYTFSGYTFVCFAGEKEGKPYIKLATNNEAEQLMNAIEEMMRL